MVFIDFINILVYCFEQLLFNASGGNLHKIKPRAFLRTERPSTLQLTAHFNHMLAASCMAYEAICTPDTGFQLVKL